MDHRQTSGLETLLHEKDVTAVSVTYNSASVLPEMLASIPASTPVIVVDNDSTDASADLAERAGATVLRNKVNVGFGSACNLGAALADTPYLLFLNPDTRLNETTIERFLGAAQKYPDAGAFNPRIMDRKGGAYFKRSSRLFPKSHRMPRGWPKADKVVTILSGSCIFVSKKNFDAVGGFDERIFLYHEDDDLTLRLRRECGPLMFIRDAVVSHMEGRSSARSPEIARLKAFHMGRSSVYARQKHLQRFPVAGNMLLAVFQLMSPELLISRRKRAKALGFLSGVWSARSDGGWNGTG